MKTLSLNTHIPIEYIKQCSKLEEICKTYKEGDFVWFKWCNKPETWRKGLVSIHGSEHKCKITQCGCECDVCYPHGNINGIKAITIADIIDSNLLIDENKRKLLDLCIADWNIESISKFILENLTTK